MSLVLTIFFDGLSYAAWLFIVALGLTLGAGWRYVQARYGILEATNLAPANQIPATMKARGTVT